MSPRERVEKALNHQEPDRVPLDLGCPSNSMSIELYKKLRQYLGISSPTKVKVGLDNIVLDIEEEILESLGIDFCRIHLKTPHTWKKVVAEDGTFRDEWGIKRKWAAGGEFLEMVDAPLKNKTIDDLEKYPWPDPYDKGRIEGLEEEVKRKYEDTEYAIVADTIGFGLFEQAWYLRGMEQLMVDMIENPDFVNALLDKILDLSKKFWDVYLRVIGKYIDVVVHFDDLGGQNGLLISPQLYRQFIKERQRQIFSFIKERTKAKLFYHTCGSVYPLIPDLIEIGIDILQPIQTSAKDMGDTKLLKERFGKNLVFWGAIDYQSVIAKGTPEEVENEVKKRIRDLSSGGGYVLSATHSMHSEVPIENIISMYSAGKKYGRY
ncbi:hypothetical protein J7M02_07750 [Candidatus Aerophobetes bacterium]|nr:hypothetical protein [Candidatus Aerophobetes bacterium]